MLPSHRTGLPCAIDVMGGDHGLSVVVEGAVAANKEYGSRSILVGPQDEIKQCLQGLGAGNLPLIIEHAPEVITMSDQPAKAVRRKPNSSLCVAYKIVQAGQASSVMSAGNTGAMMAAGRLICGLLPGIERPAIAALIPRAGTNNPTVLLDSGANVDCHAQNLVQFAIMGTIYYSSLFGEESPKVGVLSNGTESSKGNDITRVAAQMLSEIEGINSVGYVEGRDVASKVADVIVCDGFVGNVLLKGMEGCVKLILEEILLQSKKGLFSRLGLSLSKNMFRAVFKERFDYTAHGGAPLLGLTKLAVVLHGSSDARAVKNAVRVADTFSEKKMTLKIAAALTRLEEQVSDLSVNGDILRNVFHQSGGAVASARAAKVQAQLKENEETEVE